MTDPIAAHLAAVRRDRYRDAATGQYVTAEEQP